MQIPVGYYAFSGFFNFAITIIVMFIFLLSGTLERGVKKFLLLCCAMAFWSFFYFLWLSTPEARGAEWYMRTCMIGVLFMPATLLDLTLHLLRKNIKYVVKIQYSLAILLTLTVYTHWYAQGVSRVYDIPYWLIPGINFHIGLINFIIIFVYCVYLLWQKMEASTGLLQKRLIFILIGMLLGVLGGSSNYFYWYRIPIPPVLNILSIGYILFLAYALMLMDIRLVISRTVLFTFVYLPLLITPFWLIIQFEPLFMKLTGNKYWLIPMILEGILSVLGLVVYRELQDKAERYFLQEEYRHGKDIRDLANELVRFEDIDKLARLIVASCQEKMGLESAGIYIEQEETFDYKLMYQEGMSYEGVGRILKDDNMLIGLLKQKRDYVGYEEISDVGPKRSRLVPPWSIALPAFYGDELLGILILGHKKNKRMYVPIELLAFKMFANFVGFSIATMRFAEDRKRLETALYEAHWMKELGYLANTLGHELRNGLQEIASTTMNLLLHAPLMELVATNKEVEKYYMEQIEFINAHIVNLSRILDELTRFTRREDPGEIMAVDMQALWKKMIVLVMMRNPEMKHMNVEFQGQASVYGNPVQLQDLLYDMLNNSYDAIMKEKAWRHGQKTDSFYEGHIVLSLEENNDRVLMHLRDNGIGMDDRVMRELFIPLFTTKGHNQRKLQREQNLSGTGMYRIKKIMDAQEGTIEVSFSKEHEGTDFLMVLPRAQKGA